MSHFSFSRNKYDACEVDYSDKERQASFNWATDPAVVENKTSCFLATAPFSHNPFKSIPVEAIDAESELKNLSRNLSRCPEKKYHPSVETTYDILKMGECQSQDLVPEYTRTNKSCNIFSGITINRFDPLFEDLQQLKKIHHNMYTGVNTRLQIKDAFKAASS
ncbi:hypothetical protein EB118_03560 [bacterium]|nr:hypothetical protein [bacterium]NDC94057.1 hypothetical protein [bacterium]NDD82743.1 hypothetical protein [bacterium]NDG29163.1 hypothetical protein [bacterium]